MVSTPARGVIRVVVAVVGVVVAVVVVGVVVAVVVLDPAVPLSFPGSVAQITLSFWTQVRANLRESPCPSGSKGGPLTDNLLVVVVAVVVVGVVVAVGR